MLVKLEMRLIKYKFYFKEFLYRNVNGKTVIAYFIPAYTIYFLILFVTIPKVMEFSDGMKIFDIMPFGYDFDYAKKLLEAIGVEGRNIYLYQQIPFDLLFPVLSGIANCLVLAFFLNKLNSLKTPYIYLCALPLCASIFDYSENFGIISMLLNYPDLSAPLVSVTSFFSVIKSLFSTIYFVVLLVTLVAFGASVFTNLQRKGIN